MNFKIKASYKDVPEYIRFRRHTITENGQKFDGYMFTIAHPMTNSQKADMLRKFRNIRLFYTAGADRRNAVFVADKELPKLEKSNG